MICCIIDKEDGPRSPVCIFLIKLQHQLLHKKLHCYSRIHARITSKVEATMRADPSNNRDLIKSLGVFKILLYTDLAPGFFSMIIEVDDRFVNVDYIYALIETFDIHRGCILSWKLRIHVIGSALQVVDFFIGQPPFLFEELSENLPRSINT